LGDYSKAEDEAMTTSFGVRGKRRLNRVFDVIGFFYPDYYFPARKQGLKKKWQLHPLLPHLSQKEKRF
jgi:hypothetical protein